MTRAQNREAALATAVTRQQKRKAAVLREPVTSAKALAFLSKKARAASNTGKPFPFTSLGKLPPELRNRIYELSLEALPDTVNLRFFKQPALARACKQLRQEYLPMVYCRLENTAWDVPLPYCDALHRASELHLKSMQDFWDRATLPWIGVNTLLSTTKSVTFVACYVSRRRRYEDAMGTTSTFKMSIQHDQTLSNGGRYSAKHFHGSWQGAKAMDVMARSHEVSKTKGTDRVRLVDVEQVVERFGYHFRTLPRHRWQWRPHVCGKQHPAARAPPYKKSVMAAGPRAEGLCRRCHAASF